MPDYLAYGLVWGLPFDCPALLPAPPGGEVDVLVAEGAVPRGLAAPWVAGPQWEAEPGRFLWRGGTRSGRFLVQGQGQVTLEANPKAEQAVLAFHFLGSVLAAVLRQRGLLVLHATSVNTAQGAVLLGGPSGAGKSTTLAALLARGCTLLADDITALRLSAAGPVVVLPGACQLHLCEDAAAGLGRAIEGLPRYPGGRAKAIVPHAVEPVVAPLRSVYVLGTDNGGTVRLQRLTARDRFAAVQECLYGPVFADEHRALLSLAAAVVEQAVIHRLWRPARGWSVARVVDAILPNADSPLAVP